MKRNNEKVPGFDEIIFENRNKEYGAYQLRRKYLAAAFWSLAGAVAIYTLLVILFSALSEKKGIAESPDSIVVVLRPDSSIIDPNKLKQEEPEKIPEKPETRVIGPPVITDDTTLVTDMIIMDQLVDSAINRPVTEDDSIVYSDTGDNIVPKEEKVEVWLEEMPVYPGGTEALLRFINESIKYPAEASANGIQGKVFLKFVVSADGSVRRAEVVKGVDPLLDNEALRVISMMPRWKPGRQNGVPAAVWFSVPVSFRLKEN